MLRLLTEYFDLFGRCHPEAACSLSGGILRDHSKETHLHLHWTRTGAAYFWSPHHRYWWPKGQHRISQIPVQFYPGMNGQTCVFLLCDAAVIWWSATSFFCCSLSLWLLYLDPIFFSSYSDSVVLEGFAVFWPGRQSQVSTVCHRHVQGSPPGFFCPGGYERHPEVSDSQRWSLHWPLTICSHLVMTFCSC